MRQHTTPTLIRNQTAESLKKIELYENPYNEDWLQNIVFEQPNILPISEIEPVFADAVAICRELRTGSGFCDVVLVNSSGFVTIVECKLWKNPDARRKVVAQVMDYAKDIACWNYGTFEKNCIIARGDSSTSLLDIVRKLYPDTDEKTFVDNVQRNLRDARILLALVGDGIRESAEDLTVFLQRHGHLHFSLALIELPLYELPDNSGVLITPRVLTKTAEILRTVIKIEDNRQVAIHEQTIPVDPPTISETVFYERLTLSCGPQVSTEFRQLVSELNENYGIVSKLGRGKKLSLNIKTSDDRLNLASVQEDGHVWFYGIVQKTGEQGDRRIGEDYLRNLATIVGGTFDDSTKDWFWSVRKNGLYLPINEYLVRKTELVKLIEDTLRRLQRLA
jgi:hypothetical protein